MGNINQYNKFQNEEIFDKLANICHKAREKAEINRLVIRAINQTNFEAIGKESVFHFGFNRFSPRARFASALAVLILTVTSVFYFYNNKNEVKQSDFTNINFNQSNYVINTEFSQEPIIRRENLIVYQF